MVDSTVLQDSEVNAELIGRLIIEACAVPGAPVIWVTKFRRRVTPSDVKIVHDLATISSESYMELSDAEKTQAMIAMADALKTALRETPDSGCVRIEFARPKASNPWYHSVWYTGWGEAALTGSEDASGKRTSPQQTAADGAYALSTGQAAINRDNNVLIHNMARKGFELAERAGKSEGQVEFWKERANALEQEVNELEDQVKIQTIAGAVERSMEKAFGPIVALAARDDLPTLTRELAGFVGQLAALKSGQGADTLPVDREKRAEWLGQKLRDAVVKDEILSPDHLRAAATRFEADLVKKRAEADKEKAKADAKKEANAKAKQDNGNTDKGKTDA